MSDSETASLVSLDLASTEDLWDELSRRFGCCLLAYSRPGDEVGTNGCNIWTEATGVEFLGLCSLVEGVHKARRDDLCTDFGRVEED